MTSGPIVRLAGADDLQALCGVDSLVCIDRARRERIARGLAGSEIQVVEREGRILGYGLVASWFFGQPFIELVVIDAAHRGQGLGPLLIRHLEAAGTGGKLFTSTNESNGHMRHVLEKLGYARSGIIHNLDPGDPEIVYFKALPQGARP